MYKNLNKDIPHRFGVCENNSLCVFCIRQMDMYLITINNNLLCVIKFFIKHNNIIFWKEMLTNGEIIINYIDSGYVHYRTLHFII